LGGTLVGSLGGTRQRVDSPDRPPATAFLAAWEPSDRERAGPAARVFKAEATSAAQGKAGIAPALAVPALAVRPHPPPVRTDRPPAPSRTLSRTPPPEPLTSASRASEPVHSEPLASGFVGERRRPQPPACAHQLGDPTSVGIVVCGVAYPPRRPNGHGPNGHGPNGHGAVHPQPPHHPPQDQERACHGRRHPATGNPDGGGKENCAGFQWPCGEPAEKRRREV
jgi:hypothetical protein